MNWLCIDLLGVGRDPRWKWTAKLFKAYRREQKALNNRPLFWGASK